MDDRALSDRERRLAELRGALERDLEAEAGGEVDVQEAIERELAKVKARLAEIMDATHQRPK
jgi:hypothetical protein